MSDRKSAVITIAAVTVFVATGGMLASPAAAKKSGTEVRSETGSSGRGSSTDGRQGRSSSSERDQGGSGDGSSSGSSGHGSGGTSGSTHGDGLGEVSDSLSRRSGNARSVSFRDDDRL
jgi:hypothetical protein